MSNVPVEALTYAVVPLLVAVVVVQCWIHWWIVPRRDWPQRYVSISWHGSWVALAVYLAAERISRPVRGKQKGRERQPLPEDGSPGGPVEANRPPPKNNPRGFVIGLLLAVAGGAMAMAIVTGGLTADVPAFLLSGAGAGAGMLLAFARVPGAMPAGMFSLVFVGTFAGRLIVGDAAMDAAVFALIPASLMTLFVWQLFRSRQAQAR